MPDTELEKLVVRITGDSTSAVSAIQAVDKQVKDISIPGFKEAQAELDKLTASIKELGAAQESLEGAGGIIGGLAEVAASIHLARLAFDGFMEGFHHFSDTITGVRELNLELRRGELLTREMGSAQKVLSAIQANDVRAQIDPLKRQQMLQDEIRKIEMDRGQHGLPVMRKRLEDIETTTEKIGHVFNKPFEAFGLDVTTHGAEIKKLKEEIAKLEEDEVARGDKLAAKRIELLNMQAEQNIRAQHYVQHLELQLAALEGNKKAMKELKLAQLGLTEGPEADKALALLDKIQEKEADRMRQRQEDRDAENSMNRYVAEQERLRKQRQHEEDRAAEESMNKYVREQEHLRARGKSLTEQFGTPEEQRAIKLKELNELLKAGAISEQTYQRALMGTKKEKNELQHADAALIGSEQAYQKMIEYANRTLLESDKLGGGPKDAGTAVAGNRRHMTGPTGKGSDFGFVVAAGQAEETKPDRDMKVQNDILVDIRTILAKNTGQKLNDLIVANLE